MPETEDPLPFLQSVKALRLFGGADEDIRLPGRMHADLRLYFTPFKAKEAWCRGKVSYQQAMASYRYHQDGL